jgi:hypothetical protein
VNLEAWSIKRATLHRIDMSNNCPSISMYISSLLSSVMKPAIKLKWLDDGEIMKYRNNDNVS